MTSVTSHALGEIALVQQGYTFKPEYQGQSAGKWVYAKVADLSASGSSKYLRKSINYISDAVLNAMGAKPFPAGSIVFPRVGAALRNNNKRLLAQDSLTDDNVLVITVRNTELCSQEYLYYWFDFHDLQDFCNDGTVPVINGRNLKQQRVLLPSIQIQRKTAEVIDAWDNSIEMGRQLIAAKEQRYTALMQIFITNQQARHHWETIEFGAIVKERSEKTRRHDQHPVLTSSRRGLYLQSEYFSKQVTSEDNTGYKVMRCGDFTFRSMSDDGRFFFNRLTTLDAGVISPAYGVFYATACYPEFLAHFLNSPYFANALNRESQGGTRKALRFSSIAQIEIDFPSLAEQERIARILDMSLSEIDTEKKRLTALKEQKRGLMQKLLTGQWRVKVPEESIK